MLIRTLLRMLLSVTVVTAHAQFNCPEMAPQCTCSMDFTWWKIENDYVNLKTVNCSNNRLSHIPDFSQMESKTFHRLLLNNNAVRVLKRESFANITVNELVLRKNPVKHIHNDVFQDLKDSLEVLDMDSSRIKIDTGLPFLQGLTNLKVLDLGYNQLKNKYKTFPSGIFAGLDLLSLRTLTLQALQMSNIDSGAFTGIEHLEQLDLSFNFLYEFPTELLSLKNLKDLKLYSNDIEFLRNNTFKGLQNLRQLLIGVNEIDTIEDGAFNDLENSIKELNFYHNPLYKVPSDAINGLKSLTKLSLVKTNLETVPNGTFDGEYQLTELHLDHNPGLQFSDEGMFYGIEDSLETLFIRTLNLTQLPLNVLQRLSKLKYLDASNNAIKQIDKDFFKGLQLQSIQLSWNKIRNIDHLAFTAFEKGVVINLHNNNLRDLSFILELDECTFDEVHVTGNSIKCDCGVEKVINSGLVTWGLTGECYVEEDKGVKWINFQNPGLMDHLLKSCPKTKSYGNCLQSDFVSGTDCNQLSSIIVFLLIGISVALNI
ncbi:leucine-rich repeat-containing G-protein coupled receptor 4-like [Mya arenaria]|uniref:leucine-rich repeat-containing G-protein coupled receptor 4-like n=1 Tax=Mya arenaria TaxID=6604 RepID=UPI0022E8DC26|nr:leucine-rich repeat-containing G-protein coupled receptor 4-like [Mya arenaria]XP_052792139.1 leucine-rich repeat-containing G-protein coupled receptor 4-like [Mya arenaria]XP_052792140.1 leucine-rich repeat-containing G-protein coupled receptor 4-like [Mya arenaria]XP_052792141.1 leucine-rich repeat-containing G-protein coupled receptor 4-like [Mya arenaria]XP_052792142.1 leucine-rich repeat-containing G-protein coupled receptor 4-like [Mya arenaria]XP_052792143.1 leucine-rich repeat-conta